MATKAGVVRLKDIKQGRTFYTISHGKEVNALFITRGSNGHTFGGRRVFMRGIGATDGSVVVDDRGYPVTAYRLNSDYPQFIGNYSHVDLLFTTPRAALRWLERNDRLRNQSKKKHKGFFCDNDILFAYPWQMTAENISKKHGQLTEKCRESLRQLRNSLPVRAVGESELSPSAQLMLQSSINKDAEICIQHQPEETQKVATAILKARPSLNHEALAGMVVRLTILPETDQQTQSDKASD